MMPAVPDGSTRVISRIVELVDVYPTLCDLAGIECPPRRSSARAHAQLVTGGIGTKAFPSDGLQGRHAIAQFESYPPLDGVSLLDSLLQPYSTLEGGQASWPSPAQPLSGVSVPVMANESVDHDKSFAISMYPRCHPSPPTFSLSCNGVNASSIAIMGTSVVGVECFPLQHAA